MRTLLCTSQIGLALFISTVYAGPGGDGGDSKYGDDYYDGGIFGSMADTDIMIGSTSFLIVVCLVLVVENIFHMLEHLAHDTPFEDMVLAIEKELMIVGTMAFMLKLVITTSDFLPYEWFHALEFADTLVPVTSFVLAFIGIFLIMMSIHVCTLWIRAYHLHLFELLDEYIGKGGHWLQAGSFSFLPLSTVNMEMEFRIFHSIFCEQYGIQRKAFAFDEYVYLKFEKFLLAVLKIQEVNWIIIICIVCINWVRYALHWDVHECVREEDHSYKCQGEASIVDFIYCGCAMFIVTACLAVFSRYYELELMATRGITNSDDYALYLQTFEDAHSEDAPEEQMKLSEADLKIAVRISKSYIDDHKEGRSSYFDPKDLYSNVKESIHGILGIKAAAAVIPTMEDMTEAADDILDEISNFVQNDVKDKQSSGSKEQSGEVLGFVDGKHSKFGDMPYVTKSVSSTAKPKPGDLLLAQRVMDVSNHTAASEHNDDNGKTPSAKASPEIPGLSANMKARAKALVRKRVHINTEHQAEVMEEKMETGGIQARQDFKSIFWMGKPSWYFFFVQTQVMFISFYLALWVCNFLTVSYVIAQGDKNIQLKWVFLSFLPGLTSAALYMYCVKTAALLQSIVELDSDAMLEIIEQTEGTRYLGAMMRSRMLDRLREMGNPEEELKVLFDEIDDNNSNLLSRREFQIFLEALGISFSRKKWSQIFVEIDLNNDDEISFRELFLFLFPDNDSAKLEEARRLARIGLRVRDHAAKMVDEGSRRSQSNKYMKEALDRELTKHSREHKKNYHHGDGVSSEEGAAGTTQTEEADILQDVDIQ